MLRSMFILVLVNLITTAANAEIRLLVNHQDTAAISLTGEMVHQIDVEVFGTPKPYQLEIGFAAPDPVLGPFELYKISSEAGTGATAVASEWPDFTGFTLTSGSVMSLGTNFIFEYFPTQAGQTTLILFETATQDLIDSVVITVTDPVTAQQETGIFNYQGRLHDNGSPADGLYDMQFSLFADTTHMYFGQLGPVLEFSHVEIVDGYFMVDLDFGDDPNIFNGNQRWLQIAVRPGGTADPYELLSPRQRLLPAPYAVHALETETKLAALQTQVDQLTAMLEGVSRQGNTLQFEAMNLQVVSGSGSTRGTVNGLGNMIIGYNENPWAGTPDKSGSHNLVVGPGHTYTSFGGIVGGSANIISGESASVLGGLANEAGGYTSVVGGGAGNHALGARSAVLGGSSNSANVIDSAVVGGRYGQTQGSYSVVVGGGYTNSAEGNIADGDYSVVVGGRDNTALGDRSVVVGGTDNQPSGRDSVIGGGTNNQTTADATVVAAGHSLNADEPYEVLTGRKPAYDSGWVAQSAGTTIPYYHGLGGNIDNYVVDLTFRDAGVGWEYGVSILGHGGNSVSSGFSGTFWRELTDSTIKVTRGPVDPSAPEIRIRIWTEK